MFSNQDSQGELKMRFFFIRASIIASILALGIALSAPAWATTYNIDKDHSSIGFTVRHLMVTKVHGQFDDFSGTVDYDEKAPAKSSCDVDIKTTSVDTRTTKRDDHLRSSDFFDSAKFPDMTFKSKKVTFSGKKFTVAGDLTIKGTTKPVTLKGEYNGSIKGMQGETRASFTASGKINRKDFGLTWNHAIEGGGVVVGDDIDLNFEIEAVAQK
jgi:polyisoprenoid-binding protein YceI